jgi:hypothetical protein
MVLGTAAWHQSGYTWVTTLAAQASPDVEPLMAALWVSFALTLVLTAGLVLVVARVGAPNRAAVLAIAALSPLGGAAVQLAYIGFMAPTALLLADALMILIAAAAGHSPRSVPAAAT